MVKRRGTGEKIGEIDMDVFFDAFLGEALITEKESLGLSSDHRYATEVFMAAAKDALYRNCRKFVEEAQALLKRRYLVYELGVSGDISIQAGRDFWMARNQYDAGFREDDWVEEVGVVLTELAKCYGPVAVDTVQDRVFVRPLPDRYKN